jgi:arsenite methyltransferase
MTTQTNPSTSPDVRSAVREHYGKIAAEAEPKGQRNCCGSSSSSSSCGCGSNDTIPLSSISKLYEAGDVTTLPEEVTDLSLGCGDPITLASLKPGEVVLDLGSGGGIDCFLAGRRVGESGQVIGVDMTTEMIEKARRNKEKVGADNVEFRLGEIEHLPVADHSVDVVISNCVINLSPDKPQVLREAFRALKPGGRLSVSDIVTQGELPQSVRSSLAAWAGCVAGALQIDEYVAAIEAAGFTNVEITPVYWERAEIDSALGDLKQEQPGLELPEDDTVYRAVFSAKIRAVKGK